MEIRLCHDFFVVERIPSLRRITGKKDTFKWSACDERFERKPNASASREFAAHVKSKHKPESEDVSQAGFRVMRKSTEP